MFLSPELKIPSFESGSLVLEQFMPEDITEAYLDWLNSEGVMRFTEARFQKHTYESARAYVEGTNATEGAYLWRMMFDGRHIGNIRLSAINYSHGRASIALVIGDARQHSRGVGSAAIQRVFQYAIDELGLRKITAGIYAPNVGCMRAFEKAGFHQEAVLKKHHAFEGGYTDTVLMARFSDEGL